MDWKNPHTTIWQCEHDAEKQQSYHLIDGCCCQEFKINVLKDILKIETSETFPCAAVDCIAGYITHQVCGQCG